jgi:hypothetical protein
VVGNPELAKSDRRQSHNDESSGTFYYVHPVWHNGPAEQRLWLGSSRYFCGCQRRIANSNSDSNGDGYAHCHSNGNCNSNCNSYSYCYCHSHTDSYCNGVRKRHAHAKTHADSEARAISQTSSVAPAKALIPP